MPDEPDPCRCQWCTRLAAGIEEDRQLRHRLEEVMGEMQHAAALADRKHRAAAPLPLPETPPTRGSPQPPCPFRTTVGNL